MSFAKNTFYSFDFYNTEERGTPKHLTIFFGYNEILKDYWMIYTIQTETLFGLQVIEFMELFAGFFPDKKEIHEWTQKILDGGLIDQHLSILANAVFIAYGGVEILDRHWPRWKIPFKTVTDPLTDKDSVV